ncbi:MAG: alpha-ribazole phosphatase family protein [Acidobacteriota bacterium]|nr:alpha-ribazole phosphatase family protein [Acidobacteriota bacterium]
MSDILFIRHAETDMAGTFCGHSDPELNQRGFEQVAELIETLRGQDIRAVFTSNLRRSHSTANAIARHFGLECTVLPALREIYFGEWEGLRWAEIESRDKAFAQRWMADFPNLPAPGGEPVVDFETRVLEAVKTISTHCLGGTPAVVTHAGVIRTVLRKLQGCSAAEAWEKTSAYGCIVRHPSPSAENGLHALAEGAGAPTCIQERTGDQP